MLKIVTIAILSALAIGCTSKSPQLIWSDEFDKDGKPGADSWNYQLGNGCPDLCGWGNNEEEFYTSDQQNVHIENGILYINAIKSDGEWTSARITTKGKQNFTYGRTEFRAKLPKGTGTWAALWMLGENISEVGWPACGEIDILEHVGKNPGTVQSAMHTSASHGDTTDKGDAKINSYDTEFHIYAAEWKQDRIEFSVDGENYYTYQPQQRSPDNWPFDAPFYIIINLAMGGGFGGPIDPELNTARMEVDYVRAYQ